MAAGEGTTADFFLAFCFVVGCIHHVVTNWNKSPVK
jgi:hypothetical protein